MVDERTKRVLRSALQRYTWPGGYPVFLLTSDGGSICAECVRAKIREILRAARDEDWDSGWYPEAGCINWECGCSCDVCGEPIEAAYPTEERFE